MGSPRQYTIYRDAFWSSDFPTDYFILVANPYVTDKQSETRGSNLVRHQWWFHQQLTQLLLRDDKTRGQGSQPPPLWAGSTTRVLRASLSSVGSQRPKQHKTGLASFFRSAVFTLLEGGAGDLA
jgi:hypothetical protein